jgi:hypothetical protein
MDKFCKFCGNQHISDSYPKICDSCNKLTWKNPTPVAVLLQPVTNGVNRGILIGKRSIHPGKEHMNLFWSFSDRSHLLIFAETTLGMHCDQLENFVHNSECSAVRVAWEPETLCFHSHTKALKMWFEKYT